MRLLPLMLLACQAPDPLAAVPPGLHVVVKPSAFAPVLDGLARLSGTRIGAAVEEQRPAILRCPELAWLSVTAGNAAVSCTPSPELAPLVAETRTHDLAFILPDPGIGRLWGYGDVDDAGGLQVVASMTEVAQASAYDLILPSGEDPGPDVLPRAGALVHARVAQARIADVAALASDSAHENDIFGFQNQLFAATMLSGKWEVALWGVPEGGKVPRIALAVGVRSPELARAAAEQYVGVLAERWHVQPRDTTVAGAAASCLEGLNLLPELAPCWTVRGDHFVAGWNAATLEHGLSPSQHHETRSRITINLHEFAAADAALTHAFAPGAPPPAVVWPWRQVTLTGTQKDGRLWLELHAPASGSPP